MKYSVIIPIYNSENTLRRCLDSLLPQLNSETEVLLINDGSKDASGSICLEYVEKSSCFKYFEQENSGVSAARNAGIENAKGDYVLFIDSDDFVSSDMFACLDQAIENFNYDLVAFSIISTEGKVERKIGYQNFEAKSRDIIIPVISDMISKKNINGPVGKMYKRVLLNSNKIRFPIGCSISEDRAFNIAYSLSVTSMRLLSAAFYYAETSGQESLSRTIRSEKELNHHFSIEQDYIHKAFENSDLDKCYLNQIIEANNFCVCRQVYSRAKRMKTRGANKKEILMGIKSDCKDVNARKMRYPKTVYCMKIYLPVKLRMYRFVRFVSMRLAEKAV